MTPERLFYVALGSQVLYWVASFAFPYDAFWLSGLSWIFMILVPAIGFLIGRAGGDATQARRMALKLAVSWFFLGVLRNVFSREVPDVWITAMAGFAVVCFLQGSLLLLVATVATKLGGRFRAA